MKKSSKIVAVTSFAAVLSVAAFGAFAITAGGENNEPSVLYEEPTATVLSTEAETVTTTEGTDTVLEIASETVSASVVKLSVNNAKVYSANAATAPNEIGGDENLADEMAENAAYAAEKELTAAETTSAIVVGETLETTTAVAQATAKYVVSVNNDTVKSVVSCGFPNQNFGLSDKEAKSITYAAIQYLCEGTEYTGEHVEEFNALVRAAQNYNGPFKLDGVTIVVR